MSLRARLKLAALVRLGLLAFASAHAQGQSGTAVPTISLGPPSASGQGRTDDGAAESATDLAKKLQNPVGDLISIPFQNNTNFNVGPNKGTQDILNIQPVIPIHLNENWNLITRTILPLVWSPSLQPAQSVPFGLAPTSFSAFLSPKNAVDGWVWGVVPIAQLPTITSKTLGSNVWGVGPAVVVVKLAGPIVAGGLVNNVFSLGGTSGPSGTKYSLFTVNPFFNYNFGGGWFVGTAPIMTANWTSSGAKWTLPVGVQGGRLIKIGGKLPVNLLIGAYYNALRPDLGQPGSCVPKSLLFSDRRALVAMIAYGRSGCISRKCVARSNMAFFGRNFHDDQAPRQRVVKALGTLLLS